ncbi:MAG: SH3 domain-containing protein, partial [Anaerolineales bacterium]
TYRGEWMLRTPRGELFGVGPGGVTPLWVTIVTAGLAPSTDTGYDFVANACAAQWKSGAGNLPCPGRNGDARGFVLVQDAPIMENGQTGAPGLLTVPQNKTDGYIMGIYPTFTVKAGDRFRATIGCESGAKGCYVTYRLDYLTSGGATVVFWKRSEKFEGQTANVDVDLTPLAGKSVRFSLTILAAGPAAGDRAQWIAPRIVRKGGVDTPPTPSGWLTYTNSEIGFRFNYPTGSTVTDNPPNAVRIDLPFAPGTNLREKYLEAIATAYEGICLSGLGSGPTGSSSRRIVINGMDFVEQWGEDAGAGNRYQWFAYSTVRGADCLTFNFVLHSLNPGNFATPPPVFNLEGESAIFKQIVGTLVWTTTPATLYGPYTVILVRPDDALNIREAAGADQPLVGTFPPEARNILATGRTQSVGSAEWWEVRRPDGGLGWVNAFYLAEYVSPEFFVGDNRIINLIDNKLRPAMLNADGDLFASIISPRHGVTIAYHNYGGYAKTYTPAQARGIFTSAESVNWGSGASGLPDIGTFSAIVRPAFVDVFSAVYQLHPNNPMGARMYVEPWPLIYQNLNFHSLWKPGTPGVDLDWREWLIGYEYVDGKPYIVVMIHFVWEP